VVSALLEKNNARVFRIATAGERRQLAISRRQVHVRGQMSTKISIAHGRNFHLYHEALDEDYVYLELEGTKFEASYNRVMLPIPVHVWEVIRRYPGIDLKYAERTDAEIRLHVEQEVDERLKLYEEADERSKGLVSLSGALAFGTADQPRDQQIASGIEYLTKVREHQRQIKKAIEELEQANRKR
jgi:hypothetical protein